MLEQTIEKLKHEKATVESSVNSSQVMFLYEKEALF